MEDDHSSHKKGGDQLHLPALEKIAISDDTSGKRRTRKRPAPEAAGKAGSGKAPAKDNARARNRKTEQERRDRIHEGLTALREALPMLHSKMDQQQLLRHAACYIATVQGVLKRAEAAGALTSWSADRQRAFVRLITPKSGGADLRPLDARPTQARPLVGAVDVDAPTCAKPLGPAPSVSQPPAGPMPMSIDAGGRARRTSLDVIAERATEVVRRNSLDLSSHASHQRTRRTSVDLPAERAIEAVRRNSLDLSSHGSHQHQSGSGGSDPPAPGNTANNSPPAAGSPPKWPGAGAAVNADTHSSPAIVQRQALTIAYADGCVRQSQSLPNGVQRDALTSPSSTFIYVKESGNEEAVSLGQGLDHRSQSMTEGGAKSGDEQPGSASGPRGNGPTLGAQRECDEGMRTLTELGALGTSTPPLLQSKGSGISGLQAGVASRGGVAGYQTARVVPGESFGRVNSITQQRFALNVAAVGPPGPPETPDPAPAPASTLTHHPLFAGGASAAMVHQYYPLNAPPRAPPQWGSQATSPLYTHAATGWHHPSMAWQNPNQPMQHFAAPQQHGGTSGPPPHQQQTQQQQQQGPYGSYLPPGPPLHAGGNAGASYSDNMAGYASNPGQDTGGAPSGYPTAGFGYPNPNMQVYGGYGTMGGLPPGAAYYSAAGIQGHENPQQQSLGYLPGEGKGPQHFQGHFTGGLPQHHVGDRSLGFDPRGAGVPVQVYAANPNPAVQPSSWGQQAGMQMTHPVTNHLTHPGVQLSTDQSGGPGMGMGMPGGLSLSGSPDFSMGMFSRPGSGLYGTLRQNPGAPGPPRGGFAPGPQQDPYYGNQQCDGGSGRGKDDRRVGSGRPLSGFRPVQIPNPLDHQESLPDSIFNMLSGIGQGPDSLQVSPVEAGGQGGAQAGPGLYMPTLSDESFPFPAFQQGARWGGLSTIFLADLPPDVADQQAESRRRSFDG